MISDTLNSIKNTEKSSFIIAKSLYYNTDITNWYDYGARFYDPQIIRWTTVDPFANKYYSLSPYAYVANNPLLYIDSNGKEIIVGNKNDRDAVLKMINSKPVVTFAFDKSGKLYFSFVLKATPDKQNPGRPGFWFYFIIPLEAFILVMLRWECTIRRTCISLAVIR